MRELDGLREYAFKHALLHQVTYGTVLKRQRKALHAKLADWLAAQSQSDSARAGDFLGMTAQHYAEAGDEANAAEFHARAAEHAAGRLAHAAALAHVQQALAAAGPGRATARARPRCAGGCCRRARGHWRCRVTASSQAKDLDAMEGIAETLADDARRAYAVHRRATRAMRMARYAECEQFAARAAALADGGAGEQHRADEAGRRPVRACG